MSSETPEIENTNNIEVLEEDFKKTSPIEQNYDLLRKASDTRFGDIAIIHNKKTGQNAMLKESVSNSEKEARDDIIQVKRRMQLNHPYMQKMMDWSCHKQSNFCSTFFKVRGFYEFPKNDLRKEIARRKKNLKHFSHEELTHMAYQELLALEYLQNNNVSFGDLRPDHISADINRQEYKLLDRLNDPSTTFQANLNNILANRPMYCAPAIFDAIKNNKKDLDHNPFKSDCFSLGLILLEAGTMENIQNVYNHADGTVSQENIDQHLETFRQKYQVDNALLCDLTENLLTLDEEDRFDPQQFNEELPEYDEILEHFHNNPTQTRTNFQPVPQNVDARTFNQPVSTTHYRTVTQSGPEQQVYRQALQDQNNVLVQAPVNYNPAGTYSQQPTQYKTIASNQPVQHRTVNPVRSNPTSVNRQPITVSQVQGQPISNVHYPTNTISHRTSSNYVPVTTSNYSRVISNPGTQQPVQEIRTATVETKVYNPIKTVNNAPLNKDQTKDNTNVTQQPVGKTYIQAPTFSQNPPTQQPLAQTTSTYSHTPNLRTYSHQPAISYTNPAEYKPGTTATTTTYVTNPHAMMGNLVVNSTTTNPQTGGAVSSHLNSSRHTTSTTPGTTIGNQKPGTVIYTNPLPAGTQYKDSNMPKNFQPVSYISSTTPLQNGKTTYTTTAQQPVRYVQNHPAQPPQITTYSTNTTTVTGQALPKTTTTVTGQAYPKTTWVSEGSQNKPLAESSYQHIAGTTTSSSYISGGQQRMRVELTQDGDKKVYRYYSIEKPGITPTSDLVTTTTEPNINNTLLVNGQRIQRGSRKSIKVLRDGQEILEPLHEQDPTDQDIIDIKSSGVFGTPKVEKYGSPEKGIPAPIHTTNPPVVTNPNFTTSTTVIPAPVENPTVQQIEPVTTTVTQVKEPITHDAAPVEAHTDHTTENQANEDPIGNENRDNDKEAQEEPENTHEEAQSDENQTPNETQNEDGQEQNNTEEPTNVEGNQMIA